MSKACTNTGQPLLGVTLLLVSVAIGLREWGYDGRFLHYVVSLCVVFVFVLMLFRSSKGRLFFSAIALLVTAVVVAFSSQWLDILESSLITTGFLIAFLASMSSLGIPARSSPAILQSGRFLANQPPSKRYAALSVGGVLFSIFLSYGSLILLGNMTIANLKDEANERIRRIRTRRMLLAIQRAMISTICWSPLSFAVTMTLVLIPGVAWSDIVLLSLVTGLILALVGWLVDRVSSPNVAPTVSVNNDAAQGAWKALRPLLLLLVLVASLLISINELTGIRVPGVIIVLAPSLAVLWLMLQQTGSERFSKVGLRAKTFVISDLPNMRSELQILMLSGFVGSMVGKFAAPLMSGDGVTAIGLSPELLSPILVLLVLVWMPSILGQFAVHPLLSVSMLLPMLPSAAALHLSPVVLATATLAGWGLASISTPFTATVLLISNLAKTDPHTVARIWNGPCALLCGGMFSIWVVFCHFYVSGLL